jgi:hypothetical protein
MKITTPRPSSSSYFDETPSNHKRMKGDHQACLLVGINYYIAKPIEPQILVDIEKKWLPPSIKKQISRQTTHGDSK